MQFKYFLPLLLALSVSAIVCEFCIRYVLGYPDYGIDRFVYAISSSTIWQPIYKPYSRYLNNEVPVYNLGDGNHGPYLSFIRAALYDNIHDFDTVVLINDGNWEAQARHAIGQVFNDLGFREYPATRLVRATGTIRRFSRLLNLFGIVVNGRFGVGYTASIDNVKRSITLDGYSAALKLFKTKYGNNFIFVDISHDEYLGIKLSELCKDMGIEHYRRSLIKDDNLINGDGHLNYKGNKELGYFIYEVIQQHISNKDM